MLEWIKAHLPLVILGAVSLAAILYLYRELHGARTKLAELSQEQSREKTPKPSASTAGEPQKPRTEPRKEKTKKTTRDKPPVQTMPTAGLTYSMRKTVPDRDSLLRSRRAALGLPPRPPPQHTATPPPTPRTQPRQPAAQQPAAQQPATQQPVSQQPVSQQPVDQPAASSR